MDEPREQRTKLLAACSAGDQRILENLLQQYGIGSNQPRNPYCVDRSIPEEEQVTTTYHMVLAAVRSEQIDMVNFLYDRFSHTGFEVILLHSAIDTGNTNLVETLCKCDPDVANGDDDNYQSIFQLACKPENSESVKLLLKYGADPNKRSSLLFSNAHFAVLGGMPLSVLEKCFDHGYCLYDGASVLNSAVSMKRLDLVELFFRQGKEIAEAEFSPKEKLIELARENADLEMEKLINSVYPRKKKGLLDKIVEALRLRSQPSV